jgi:hypothetical protein
MKTVDLLVVIRCHTFVDFVIDTLQAVEYYTSPNSVAVVLAVDGSSKPFGKKMAQLYGPDRVFVSNTHWGWGAGLFSLLLQSIEYFRTRYEFNHFQTIDYDTLYINHGADMAIMAKISSPKVGLLGVHMKRNDHWRTIYGKEKLKFERTFGSPPLTYTPGEGVQGGCFTGDTKISLVDGTEVLIKDLVGRASFWVYSYDVETGRVVLGKATAKKTRRNAQLVEVTLDNGEAVKCTPDHRWMLRDGSYREAKDLKPGDSLMPLYRKYDNSGLPGYELLWEPTTLNGYHWHFAHRVFATSNVPINKRGYTVHHRNFDKRDNRPENLEWMANAEHTRYHTSRGDRGFKMLWKDPLYRKKMYEIHHSEEWHKKVLKGCQKNRGVNNPSRRAEVREMLHQLKTGKSMNFSPEIIKKLSLRAKLTNSIRNFKDPEYRKNLSLKLRAYYKNHPRKSRKVINHKVLSVVHLLTHEDVYCLQVEKYHNFALTAGVFVHNCMTLSASLLHEMKLRRMFEAPYIVAKDHTAIADDHLLPIFVRMCGLEIVDVSEIAYCHWNIPRDPRGIENMGYKLFHPTKLRARNKDRSTEIEIRNYFRRLRGAPDLLR